MPTIQNYYGRRVRMSDAFDCFEVLAKDSDEAEEVFDTLDEALKYIKSNRPTDEPYGTDTRRDRK